MSMLSEPRQRRKWLLSPGAGQAWVSDDNKYGQKLMEKMGWTKGKGLGRDEQGNPEHIRISLKDNKKGIGYKGYDDQWIKHYEGFEDVLSKLNNIEETEGNSKDSSRAASSDEESQSIQSLERRSKCSRARVHYHKFARGKDLSRYSKDDIACITGSKRAKQLAEEENEADKSDETDEPALPSDTPQITTINSGSVQDYFAQKMAQLKGKLPLALMQPKEYESDEELRVGFGMKHEYNKKINEQEIKVQTAINEEQEINGLKAEREQPKGVNKKKRYRQETTENADIDDSYKVEICDESKTMEAEEENGINISPEGETDQQEKKKKKKKKRAERDAEAKVEEQEIISHEVSIDDGVSTSKKKKKKRRELEVEFPEENEYEREEQMPVSDEIISHEGRLEHDELPKKKKKTKKEKIVEEETVTLDDIAKENKDIEEREEQEKSITQGEDEQHDEVKVPKKKKKQRKMQEPIVGEEVITQLEAEDNQEALAGEKKNNKKRKEREGETANGDENIVEEALNDDECTQKQKKKRKKSKKKPRKAKEVTSSQMKQEQANSEEGQGNNKEAQVDGIQKNGEKETGGVKRNKKRDNDIKGRNDTQSNHSEGTGEAIKKEKQGMNFRNQRPRRPFSQRGRFRTSFQSRRGNRNFFNSDRAFNRQGKQMKVKPVFTTQGCEQGFQHFKGALSYEGYTM